MKHFKYGFFICIVTFGHFASAQVYTNEVQVIENLTGVGIGVSNPAEALHVAGNFRLSRGTTQGAFGDKIQWGWNMGPYISSVMTGTDADLQGLVFYTHSSGTATNAPIEALRITHDRKVGLGTSAPVSNLDVLGTGGIYQIRYSEDANAPIFLGRKSRGTTAAPLPVIAGDNLVSVLGQGATDAGTFSGTAAGMYMSAAESFTATARGSYLRFHTTAIGSTSLAERMRITDAGNVGIGASAPAERLHVQASSAVDGSTPVTLRVQSATNSSSWTTGAEYARLDFASSDVSGNGAGTKIRIAAISENSALSASGLTFYTNNGATFAETMRIKGNGSVGIGTTAPTQKLDVNGNIKWGTGLGILKTEHGGSIELGGSGIPYVDFSNDMASDYDMRIILGGDDALNFHGGNVCIGYNPPTHRFTVEGDARAVRFIADNNTWSDFVFEDTYSLMPLPQLEKYVKENKHLPEIPTEAEVKANGTDLAAIDAKLLQKIEELTLYLIEQNKKIEMLQDEINQLKKK